MVLRRICFSWLMVWVIVAAFGIYSIIPLRQSLKLGADLVGGTFLTLKVQVQDAVKAELVSKMKSIESSLKQSQKLFPISLDAETCRLVIVFPSLQDLQETSELIKKLEPELQQKTENLNLYLFFSPQKIKQIENDAVERNIEVLHIRLNSAIAEIPILKKGEHSIVVELPDVADAMQAKALIGKVAQLDFRLVDEYAATQDDILYKYDGVLPDNKEILPGKASRGGYYLVTKYADITGNMLKKVSKSVAERDHRIEYQVAFKFNSDAADAFYDLTSKNHGRQLAIILDEVVIQAPVIQAPLRGEGVITGGFTEQETEELVSLLQSGSFVARVTFEEERQIGPALGAQARHDGLMSCLVGLGLLFMFSVIYYGLSGFFAFLALLYNMILVLVGLHFLKATLTLPGIGGMVLTIGMAIDASILIFERIKEELARGHGIKQSITDGFSDAMVVIIDANITTFVVAVVLYYFGTGPIQGFAVTMMLGIVATLMSGLFFLRSLFMFMVNNFTIQKLRI